MNSPLPVTHPMRDASLLTCVAVEFAKLRRSLALLLCAASPLFVAVLMAVMFNRRADGGMTWNSYLASHAAMWALFMLPMSATALTVLLAQMEHGPRMWNHLLALPVPRWSLLVAKLVVAMALCGAMTLALAVTAPVLGALADRATPASALTGSMDWPAFAGLLARMWASAWLLVAVQLWAACRWRSFVPPLVLGIGGTFVAVAAAGADIGPYFPWLIPISALASKAGASTTALWFGIVAGAGCSALMVVDTQRRLLR